MSVTFNRDIRKFKILAERGEKDDLVKALRRHQIMGHFMLPGKWSAKAKMLYFDCCSDVIFDQRLNDDWPHLFSSYREKMKEISHEGFSRHVMEREPKSFDVVAKSFDLSSKLDELHDELCEDCQGTKTPCFLCERLMQKRIIDMVHHSDEILMHLFVKMIVSMGNITFARRMIPPKEWEAQEIPVAQNVREKMEITKEIRETGKGRRLFKTSVFRVCSTCLKVGNRHTIKHCSCLEAYYCSTKCQENDWNDFHQKECAFKKKK
jgi:hypothetical protein